MMAELEAIFVVKAFVFKACANFVARYTDSFTTTESLYESIFGCCELPLFLQGHRQDPIAEDLRAAIAISEITIQQFKAANHQLSNEIATERIRVVTSSSFRDSYINGFGY